MKTVRRAGRSATPAAAATVRDNYIGRLLDGREFENTYAIDHPAEFPLGQVMPRLREGSAAPDTARSPG
jgi:FKBP-type peptidyl-prolyl cis-trans isomerase FkpA